LRLVVAEVGEKGNDQPLATARKTDIIKRDDGRQTADRRPLFY